MIPVSDDEDDDPDPSKAQAPPRQRMMQILSGLDDSQQTAELLLELSQRMNLRDTLEYTSFNKAHFEAQQKPEAGGKSSLKSSLGCILGAAVAVALIVWVIRGVSQRGLVAEGSISQITLDSTIDDSGLNGCKGRLRTSFLEIDAPGGTVFIPVAKVRSVRFKDD